MVTYQEPALLDGEGAVTASLPVLLALVRGVADRCRIRDAIRGRAHAEFVDRIADLMRRLDLGTPPVAIILVEPQDADCRDVAPTVRHLHQQRSGLVLVGYCQAGHAHSSQIRALAAAGAHELLFRGIDDSGIALRSVLAGATQACAAEIIVNHVRPLVADSLLPFMSFCLRYPDKAHTVREVAAALGINRKTLVNYSTRAESVAPAELLAWCRCLLAAQYLATTTRTVASIALQLDMPSDTALRNLIKRYTGLRAGEVRANGGLSCVLDRFADALVARRAKRRDAAYCTSLHRTARG